MKWKITDIQFHNGDLSHENVIQRKKCWSHVSFILQDAIHFKKLIIFFDGDSFNTIIPEASGILYTIIDRTLKNYIKGYITAQAIKYFEAQ
jgi:hypothetical protein